MGRGEHENRDVPTVLVERLPHAEGLPLPGYATPGSAGADLCAAIRREAGERAHRETEVPGILSSSKR